MTAAYVVTATRVDQLQADGSEKKHFRGDVVTDFSDEDIARHLHNGNIAPQRSAEAKDAKADAANDDAGGQPATDVGNAAPPSGDDDASSDGGGDAAVDKPKQAHSTDAWRDYAVASRQMDRETADATSKRELIKKLR